MIEDDFYATIKLKCGDEIFCKVAASEEEDRTLLIITNPITVSLIKSRGGTAVGYKFEPWLKTTLEDMFIINIKDVITMSESSDIEMIFMYQNYVSSNDKNTKGSQELNRKMGYLGKVNDTKDLLEKIYKNS